MKIKVTQIAFGILLLAGRAAAQDILTPSGQAVSLFDVILDTDTDTARFRFLAPAIGPSDGAKPFEEVQGDFQWLCEMAALPALAANDWHVDHLVISMSDREIAFGSADETVVQYFEGFRLADGACVWEVF